MDDELGDLVIGETEGVKHDRPVNGMRGDEDVLADDLRIRRPDGLKLRQAFVAALVGHVTSEGDVVRERIEPHVVHKALVKGKGNAPAQSLDGTADAQVLWCAFKGVQHIIGAVRRVDEIGMAADVVFEPLDVIAEAEIPIFFLEFDDLTPLLAVLTIRTAFFVGQELLLAHGVEARVALFV